MPAGYLLYADNKGVVSLILRGRWVLPVTRDPIPDGGILIKDGVICALSDGDSLEKKYPDEEVLLFENEVVMPGFVNLHAHIEYSVMQGKCRGGSFLSWIQDLIKEARGMNESDWLESSRYGARLMIESGVTCLGDISKTDTSFQAIYESGLRAVVFLEVIGLDEMEADRIIDDLRLRLLKVKDRGSERVGLGLSPHAPYTVSKRLFEEVARTAHQRKLPIMVHLSETADEEAFVREGKGLFADIFKKAAGWGDVSWNGLGLSAAMYLDTCGILAEKTIATHAVHLSKEDIRLLRARNVSVAHCPRSNAFLGVGRAPVKTFLDEGVLVGLGTDSLASNDQIDFFDEMRALDPSIPLDLRIRMATINGARALGLGDKIGSIEVGKYADLIAVTVLSDDPYDVCLATKDDICLVMVEGSVLHES